jgi:hypothetical protein
MTEAINIRSDPATYRLIELLFGKAKDINRTEVSFTVPWTAYIYAAGDNMCTASPTDNAPSNTVLFYAPASYEQNGIIKGSFVSDVERYITEVGILLFMQDTKVLIAKTCLAQPVRVTPGQEFTVRFAFSFS